MEVYTVSQINAIIKNYVESNDFFRSVCIEAEVSNITYQLKHMYMSLKDSNARIKCACFSYRYNDIPLDLKEGDKVKVYGDINVYLVDASVQIIAKRVEKQDMLGELYKKLELLKKEYQEKGHFDEGIKKKLPSFPRRIGVVTSDTGDAIRDIIRNTHNRDPKVEIILYPAKVQGKDAEYSIARGIEFFNKHKELEVECLIIGRGGGSIEDLWAFNERAVIEAVHESSLPIISAVGHEADNLLSDLVADKRASTPTHAPHCLIKNKKDIDEKLNEYKKRLDSLLVQRVKLMKTRLESIEQSYIIQKFYENTILNRQQRLDEINSKLDDNISKYLYEKRVLLEKIRLNTEKYDNMSILKRGYTVTYVDGKLLKDTKVKKGSILKTVSSNDEVISEVK